MKSPAESLKHSLHVASLLHGDDPGVILLIDPNQEILLVVVPAQTVQSYIELDRISPCGSSIFAPKRQWTDTVQHPGKVPIGWSKSYKYSWSSEEEF